MKILSINCGSSTLKASLFELPENNELMSANFERIGGVSGHYTIKFNGEKIKREADMRNHGEAIKYLIEELVGNKIISSIDEIDGVGHRIVHGGTYYNKSEIIDNNMIARIEELCDLAPLHNPANIMGINSFKEALPNVPMVGVFDTAFHQTMDAEQFLYPTPYEWYEKYGVRKYGFHGTSHRYIDKKISEELGRDDLKIISCHIGSGASVCAIKDHKSVDTSMGFTPLAGVMMGTRSGDIDAGIIQYIMNKENKTIDEVINILNKQSGFIGVSGISNDARDLEKAIEEGNEQAILTYDKASRTIANYMAMYNNILNGADVICFTAGLGERSEIMRAMVADRLTYFGVELDKEANKVWGEFQLITTPASKIAIYVVPTNEELMIAMDTYELIK